MRASRLVSIILLLQARGQMTAGQLAAELEVSVRTIYRDVGSLQAAGIPLYGDAGPAGGYQLVGYMGFEPDPAIRTAQRIEQVLRTIEPAGDDDPPGRAEP